MKKPSEIFDEASQQSWTFPTEEAVVKHVLDEMADLERKRFEFVLELMAQNRGLLFRKEVLEQTEVYKSMAEKEGLL